MKNIMIAGIIAIATITLFACKKSDDAPPAAKLTIASPLSNQTFHFGDTVHIEGTASNVASLHGYDVSILNSNNDTLFHEHEHTHAAQLDIDEIWINNQSVAQELKVIVVVPVNHEGEELKQEIMINVLP